MDEDEDFPLPDMYSEDSDHGEESDEDQMAEAEEAGHRRQRKLVKAMSVGVSGLSKLNSAYHLLFLMVVDGNSLSPGLLSHLT